MPHDMKTLAHSYLVGKNEKRPSRWSLPLSEFFDGTRKPERPPRVKDKFVLPGDKKCQSGGALTRQPTREIGTSGQKSQWVMVCDMGAVFEPIGDGFSINS